MSKVRGKTHSAGGRVKLKARLNTLIIHQEETRTFAPLEMQNNIWLEARHEHAKRGLGMEMQTLSNTASSFA